MNGGAEKIDTSYEKLRSNIQKRLSVAKNKEEYISLCKKILQEIVKRPDGDKFLSIYEDKKTLFYDFTPTLIKEVQSQMRNQNTNISEQQKNIKMDIDER